MNSDISSIPCISEATFAKFISDNVGCDVLNVPNSTWKYDHTDFGGSLSEQYETYFFKKSVMDNPKCNSIEALVIKGRSVNFTFDIKMSKRELYNFVSSYKKLYFPDYTLAMCKKEFGKEQSLIEIEDFFPCLSIDFPFMRGEAYTVTFYTLFCNKDYIDGLKTRKKKLTLDR